MFKMFLVFYVTAYFIFYTTQAKKGKGPICYGRSDCVTPLLESAIENATEDITTESKYPKRYIILDEFKGAVFGAYKYDPIKGDFMLPNKTTTNMDGLMDAGREIVMRAGGDEPITEEYQNQTTTTTPTTQPVSESLSINTTQSKNESENAVK